MKRVNFDKVVLCLVENSLDLFKSEGRRIVVLGEFSPRDLPDGNYDVVWKSEGPFNFYPNASRDKILSDIAPLGRSRFYISQVRDEE